MGTPQRFAALLQDPMDAPVPGRRIMLLEVDAFGSVALQQCACSGEPVLSSVAESLVSRIGADAVYRTGGNQFGIVLPDGGRQDADQHFARARTVASANCLGATLSGGSASWTREDPSGGKIAWEQADAALQEAKRRGCGTHVAFDADTMPAVTGEMVLALRAVLEQRRLSVVYQPIHQVQTGALVGLEVLSRPLLDQEIGPSELFHAAARTGQVPQLDALCRELAFADGPGFDMPPAALLFVNVSPLAFGHPSLGTRALREAVAGAGLSPERVVIEVTEQTTLDRRFIANEIDRLRAAGFKVALDDVGAGNAGLELLRHLEVDFLKIDGSIVGACRKDGRALAVLAAVCEISAHSGTAVIAEGVEDPQVLAFLRRAQTRAGTPLNVTAAQGFHIGKPVPQPRMAA